MISPSITAIVPNYNGSELLGKNLPSVISALKRYGHGSALIVVDDGSKDTILMC